MTTGIVIISHGLRARHCRESFCRTVAEIAARLPAASVHPAFLQDSEEGLTRAVEAAAAAGARRIIVLPYFLHTGTHVAEDIPAEIGRLAAACPGISIECLPSLEKDAALQDLLVERLQGLLAPAPDLPATGQAIEAESLAIIDRRLATLDAPEEARAVIRRVIHATADFSFAENMRIHSDALQRGRDALAQRLPIICDSSILRAGITRTASECLCAIRDEDVSIAARAQGTTRAAMAMEKLAPHMENAIVAIGNAPTALFKVLDIAAKGAVRPALVVGLPVGFVGARESKLALLASDLCYITNTSCRGGSPAAAAAVNALAILAREGR